MNKLFLSLLLAATPLSLEAGVTVSQSEQKPEHSVVSYEADQPTGRGTAFYRGRDGLRHIGQAITIPEGGPVEMSGVTFRTYDYDPGVLGKRFSIKVFQLPDGKGTPDPEGDLISSQEGTLPDDLEERAYITFSLDEPVPLSGGRTYIVLFAFEEPTSDDQGAVSLGFERSEGPAAGGRTWAWVTDRFVADRKSMIYFLHSNPR